MTIIRIAILCARLCPIIPMIGCSAMTHLNSTNQDSLRYYDETAHYNAVKNLWFGLDAP